jgi:hypothetical protein
LARKLFQSTQSIVAYLLPLEYASYDGLLLCSLNYNIYIVRELKHSSQYSCHTVIILLIQKLIWTVTYKGHDKIPFQQNVLPPCLFYSQIEKPSFFLFDSTFSV